MHVGTSYISAPGQHIISVPRPQHTIGLRPIYLDPGRDTKPSLREVRGLE